MTLKKLILIVGSLIALVAAVMGVFNGVNYYHIALTFTGMTPGLAVVQSIIAGVFTFFVWCFIGAVGTCVVGAFVFVISAVLLGAKKPTPKPGDGNSSSDGK
jgi:hypothetical protein